MYKVSCKDISPSTNCEYEASGSSDDEAVTKMASHMRSDHSDDIEGMADEEVRAMIEPKVVESPAVPDTDPVEVPADGDIDEI